MTNTNENARWRLSISRDTDLALRQFLASQGNSHKGDLSRFVEKAVKFYMFNLVVEEVKRENTAYSQAEIDRAIDEALEWALQ